MPLVPGTVTPDRHQPHYANARLPFPGLRTNTKIAKTTQIVIIWGKRAFSDHKKAKGKQREFEGFSLLSPSGAVRSAPLVLIPLLPFGSLRHQNCFSPSCFLPCVPITLRLPDHLSLFMPQSCFLAVVALSLSIF